MSVAPEQHARQWKGVWIPKAVWTDPRLSWMEKCLLAEIGCLEEEKKGCTASNAYLATVMGTSPTHISNVISKLRDFNYITTASFDGRRRSICTIPESKRNNGHGAFSKIVRQTSVEPEGRVAVPLKAEQGTIILESIDQRIDESTPKVPKGDEELLEKAARIYEAYPRKVGRPTAIKVILAILKGSKKHPTAFPFGYVLERTLLCAASWAGATEEEMHFCPHPATWFNQERFNDDPATWRPVRAQKSPLGALRLRKEVLEKRVAKLEEDVAYESGLGPELKQRREELKKVLHDIMEATK